MGDCALKKLFLLCLLCGCTMTEPVPQYWVGEWRATKLLQSGRDVDVFVNSNLRSFTIYLMPPPNCEAVQEWLVADTLATVPAEGCMYSVTPQARVGYIEMGAAPVRMEFPTANDMEIPIHKWRWVFEKQ